MAELREYLIKSQETISAAIDQVDVIGLGDLPAVVAGIVPDDIAAVARLAHIELETVASLRECVFERDERVFHESAAARATVT